MAQYTPKERSVDEIYKARINDSRPKYDTTYNFVSWEYDKNLAVINKNVIFKDVDGDVIKKYITDKKLKITPDSKVTDLFRVWWNNPPLINGEYVGRQTYYSLTFM